VWVIWVDVAAVVIGLGFLALVALKLYGKIKHFGGVIKQTNSQISALTDELSQAQASRTK
jgi:hypothetical protein